MLPKYSLSRLSKRIQSSSTPPLPVLTLSRDDTVGTLLRQIRERLGLLNDQKFRCYRLPLEYRLPLANSADEFPPQGTLDIEGLEDSAFEPVAPETQSAVTLYEAQLNDPITRLLIEVQEDDQWLRTADADSNTALLATATAEPPVPQLGGSNSFFNKAAFGSAPKTSAPKTNILQPRKANGLTALAESDPKKRSTSPHLLSSMSNMGKHFTRSSTGSGKTKGVTGLSNLGNTCVSTACTKLLPLLTSSYSS